MYKRQNITLTSVDASSGVAGTYWRFGDVGSYTKSASVPVPATAGNYTIYYFAIDNAGNTEGQKSNAFNVASTPPQPVYRFFNKTNGSHFYTASEAEKNNVVANLSATYSLDGPAYHWSTAFTTPLYRFFNMKNGSHFYTASEAEKNNVLTNLSATYSFDGPAYNVSSGPAAGTVPVYRFFNMKNGSHFYTASEAEKNNVVANLSATYSLDGVAFHVLP